MCVELATYYLRSNSPFQLKEADLATCQTRAIIDFSPSESGVTDAHLYTTSKKKVSNCHTPLPPPIMRHSPAPRWRPEPPLHQIWHPPHLHLPQPERTVEEDNHRRSQTPDPRTAWSAPEAPKPCFRLGRKRGEKTCDNKVKQSSKTIMHEPLSLLRRGEAFNSSMQHSNPLQRKKRSTLPRKCEDREEEETVGPFLATSQSRLSSHSISPPFSKQNGL